MTCEDAAYDSGDDADFQRWYFGGSPPESDCWPRHAFEDALHGVRPALPEAQAPHEHFEVRTPDRFALA